MSFSSIRQFLALLSAQKQLITIDVEVDPHLEIAEIHRRVVAQEGPVLLFRNVKGSQFPVVTNLFGTAQRVAWAFGENVDQTIEEILHLFQHPPESKKELFQSLWQHRPLLTRLMNLGKKPSKQAPLFETTLSSLEEIPFLTSWPLDGGPFLTLPLVYTESIDPSHASANLGMYRIQRFGPRQTGLHFQINKGGGYHFWQAEQKKQNLPVSILLGGPPALIASAIAPLPENVNELLLASFLMKSKIPCKKPGNWPHSLPIEAEFAICGHAIAGKRKLEGPFGDHYGYYSLAHDFPYLEVEHIYARKDAIYPATIVGKPVQEDMHIGYWLQETMRPLIRLAMPGVEDLWAYGESGFHALAGARIQERYERESLKHALRILGEGQLSLTKCLLLTDQNVNIRDIKKLLEHILERMRPEVDLYIFAQMSLDTLDYTGPKLNHGSRAIFMGLGDIKRLLPKEIDSNLSGRFAQAKAFCGGCLVVQGKNYSEDPTWAQKLLETPLNPWLLVIVVDDVEETCRSNSDFLWSVFMRFDPAQDIYTHHHVVKHHLCHSWPIVIDARFKPHYPAVVEVDGATQEKVSARWDSYFNNRL